MPYHHHNTMISPVVVLERLPIQFKQNNCLKEFRIPKTENELNHSNKNSLKLKKMKKKSTRFKRNLTNVSNHSVTQKSNYNDKNTLIEKMEAKLLNFKKAHTKRNVSTNSGVYRLRRKKILPNADKQLTIMKSPIVVLERLPIDVKLKILRNKQIIIPNRFGSINKCKMFSNILEENIKNENVMNVDENINVMNKNVIKTKKRIKNLKKAKSNIGKKIRNNTKNEDEIINNRNNDTQMIRLIITKESSTKELKVQDVTTEMQHVKDILTVTEYGKQIQTDADLIMQVATKESFSKELEEVQDVTTKIEYVKDTLTESRTQMQTDSMILSVVTKKLLAKELEEVQDVTTEMEHVKGIPTITENRKQIQTDTGLIIPVVTKETLAKELEEVQDVTTEMEHVKGIPTITENWKQIQTGTGLIIPVVTKGTLAKELEEVQDVTIEMEHAKDIVKISENREQLQVDIEDSNDEKSVDISKEDLIVENNSKYKRLNHFIDNEKIEMQSLTDKDRIKNLHGIDQNTNNEENDKQKIEEQIEINLETDINVNIVAESNLNSEGNFLSNDEIVSTEERSILELNETNTIKDNVLVHISNENITVNDNLDIARIAFSEYNGVSTEKPSIFDINEMNKSEDNVASALVIKHEIIEQALVDSNISDDGEIDNLCTKLTATSHSKKGIHTGETNENNFHQSRDNETDILTGDLIIDEHIEKIEINENEDDLSCNSEIYEEENTNLSRVIDATNDETMCNNAELGKSKSISLEQVCKQMSISGLQMFEKHFDANEWSYISEESDVPYEFVDIQSVNKSNTNGTAPSSKSRRSNMKFYREICMNCNKVQERINNKALSKCQTCQEDVYYACVECNKEYKYISGVYKHVMVNHTKNENRPKPIKCLRCGREFKMSFNMKDHLRFCMLDACIQCPFCPLKTKRKSSARKHLLRMHSRKFNVEEIEDVLEKVVENSKELRDKAEQKLTNQFGSSPTTSRLRPFPIRNYIQLYCDQCKIVIKKQSGKDQRSCLNCRTKLQLECRKCGRRYKYRSSMSVHLQNQCLRTEPIVINCDQCEYVTCTKSRLTRHIQRRHAFILPSEYVTCNRCQKSFRLKEDLRNHKYICGKIPHLHCEFCDYRAKHKSLLRSHIDSKHPETRMGIIQPTKNNVGDEGEIISESIEILEFKTESGLDITPNIINASAILSFEENLQSQFISDSIKACCTNCNLEIRAMEKITKCQVCYTPFIYCCTRCNQIRRNFILLRLHVIRKHSEKTHHCPSCERSFSYENDYRQHQKICNLAPYLHCHRCSFQTKYKSTFQAHIRRGTCVVNQKLIVRKRDRVYCYKCGKDFGSQLMMSKHVNRCGLSKKILSCSHCNFMTAHKHLLINHIQSKHASRLFRNVDAFQCSACTLMFKNYFVYSRHIEKRKCREKKK